MCFIEERTYIYPDKTRRMYEYPELCEMSVNGRACPVVTRRQTERHVPLANASYEAAPPLTPSNLSSAPSPSLASFPPTPISGYGTSHTQPRGAKVEIREPSSSRSNERRADAQERERKIKKKYIHPEVSISIPTPFSSKRDSKERERNLHRLSTGTGSIRSSSSSDVYGDSPVVRNSPRNYSPVVHHSSIPEAPKPPQDAQRYTTNYPVPRNNPEAPSGHKPMPTTRFPQGLNTTTSAAADDNSPPSPSLKRARKPQPITIHHHENTVPPKSSSEITPIDPTPMRFEERRPHFRRNSIAASSIPGANEIFPRDQERARLREERKKFDEAKTRTQAEEDRIHEDDRQAALERAKLEETENRRRKLEREQRRRDEEERNQRREEEEKNREEKRREQAKKEERRRKQEYEEAERKRYLARTAEREDHHRRKEEERRLRENAEAAAEATAERERKREERLKRDSARPAQTNMPPLSRRESTSKPKTTKPPMTRPGADALKRSPSNSAKPSKSKPSRAVQDWPSSRDLDREQRRDLSATTALMAQERAAAAELHAAETAEEQEQAIQHDYYNPRAGLPSSSNTTINTNPSGYSSGYPTVGTAGYPTVTATIMPNTNPSLRRERRHLRNPSDAVASDGSSDHSRGHTRTRTNSSTLSPLATALRDARLTSDDAGPRSPENAIRERGERYIAEQRARKATRNMFSATNVTGAEVDWNGDTGDEAHYESGRRRGREQDADWDDGVRSSNRRGPPPVSGRGRAPTEERGEGVSRRGSLSRTRRGSVTGYESDFEGKRKSARKWF
jgi:hypothetical protein